MSSEDFTPGAGTGPIAVGEEKVIWALCNAKGSYETLTALNKERKFGSALMKGKYSFRAETDSFGGGPRKIHVHLSVLKKDGNEITKEKWKIYGSKYLAYHEFEVTEADEPAPIEIHIRSGALLAPMNAYVLLMRHPNLDGEVDDNDAERLQSTLTFQDIKGHLTRTSEYKLKAFKEGLIRPFLYMVSMHPQTRFLLGKILGIKLLNSKYGGDPHAEAWALIDTKMYGLRSRTQYAPEFSKDIDWYTMLYRAETDAFKSKLPKPGSVDQKKTECQTMSSEVVENLEREFLCNMGKKFHKKLSSDNPTLASKCANLLEGESFQKLVKQLTPKSPEPAIARFFVELCADEIYEEAMSQLNEDDDDDKESEEQAEKRQKEKAKELEIDMNVIVSRVQTNLFKGIDMRTKAERKSDKAKTAAKVGAMVGLKIVLMTFLPMVAVAMTGVMIFHKIFGPSHDKSHAVLVQMLIHRMLLNQQGIYIEEYY